MQIGVGSMIFHQALSITGSADAVRLPLAGLLNQAMARELVCIPAKCEVIEYYSEKYGARTARKGWAIPKNRSSSSLKPRLVSLGKVLPHHRQSHGLFTRSSATPCPCTGREKTDFTNPGTRFQRFRSACLKMHRSCLRIMAFRLERLRPVDHRRVPFLERRGILLFYSGSS